MQREYSLPHSQEPANCPYPEPDQSPSHILKINFNIILPLPLPFMPTEIYAYLKPIGRTIPIS